jgi:hypothetical protein
MIAQRKANRAAFINIIVFGLLFVVLSLFLGCSPQERLARMVKHHPELLQPKQVEIPVFYALPAKTLIDTHFVRTGDTVFFDNNVAVGSVFCGDTFIKIKVITKTDTIRDTIPIEIQTIKVEQKDSSYG